MKYFLTCVLFLLTCSCSVQLSNGQNGGQNSSYGTLAFNKPSLNLSLNGTNTDVLTLSNSTGVNNLNVSFTIANSNIASLQTSSCILSSSGTNNQCTLLITGLASGTTTIVATASYNGYNYTIAPITVNVSNVLNGASGVTMSEKGITETIYNGLTYNATFTFTNNTSAPINLGQMSITGASALGVSIDPTPCSNMTLTAGAHCSVLANNASIATANTLAPLDFTLNAAGSSTQFYNFNMDIVAVAYHPGYAAFRISNVNNPGHTLYLVALGLNAAGTQGVVVFDRNMNGSLNLSASYYDGYITISNSTIGTTFYQADYTNGLKGGNGGLMYVSFDKKINITNGQTGPAPWVTTDPSYGITFSQYEPNVYTSAAGVFSANLDITDINFVGLTQGFHALSLNNGGPTSNNNMQSGLVARQYSNLTTSQIYDNIFNTLSVSYPTIWGFPSLYEFSGGSPRLWTEILGLPNWLGDNQSPPGSGFNLNLYTGYDQDLWTYYASGSGHYIYIDAGEIQSGCILKAQVNSATTMLVEPTDAGALISSGVVSSTLCPASASADGINTWTWNTFTPADFVGGAGPGAGSNSLYGVNKSYKSMGKYVSAAQSVGMLPYCPNPGANPDAIYGQTFFQTNGSQFWTNQYKNCLQNVSNSQYSTYGDSVMNQYDKMFHQYIPLNYGWSYDDALGISSEVNIDPTKSGFTLDIHKFD